MQSVANKPLPADDLRSVVEQVGDAWEQLHGKRIAIIGCDGFVGRWMTESLDYWCDGWNDVWLARVNGKCEEWWPRWRPDYIVHATTDGVGWQHVAAVARAAGARMLLLSSGAVYNQQWSYRNSLSGNIDRPVNAKEEWWTCNVAPDQWPAGYAYDKARQEHECRDVAVIARLFSFIGPGLRRHAGRAFLEDDPITVNDDGAVRSYLYASDMAAFCWRALLLGQVGRAYNVGSGEAIGTMEFAGKCALARGHKMAPQLVGGSGGTYYVPDVSRAERELGCRQTVGLDDAIRRTLAWQAS